MKQDGLRFRDSQFSSKVLRLRPSGGPSPQITFMNEANGENTSDHELLTQKVQPSYFPSAHQADVDQMDGQSADPGHDLSWPVEREQEAVLIRHFASTVSQFFDFCDPQRHFARVVPQRMRTNPTLANAVFALSARHFSRVSTFDAHVADLYYQRCLQQLIPALARNVQDESLLVAAVVLRLMEEIDVPVTGADLQNHLVGTQAIARAQEQRLLSADNASGLLRAAHWAALRQDLYMAFASQRPLLLRDLDFFRAASKSSGTAGLTVSTENDDDDACWADLAVLHCCDVAQFVFGPNNGDMQEYQRLRSVSGHWRHEKPSSFEPFFHKGRTPCSPIPDIRLLSSWHVMGYMYHCLSQLLLDMNTPSDFEGEGEINGRVSLAVCEMIGIALHNTHTPSAHLVASMAIALCGHRLAAEAEETELLAMKQVLANTERIHGWPTKAAQGALAK